MKDKFAIVTGGSKNIGAAICKRLSEDGLKVISIDVAEPTHKFITSHYQVDLSEPKEAEEAFASINSEYDVTYLVNNVGLVSPNKLEDSSVSHFDQILKTNTLSALIALKSVLQKMKMYKFGRVVSISSRAHLGKELRTSYSASKGALVAMTRTWALELGKYGITVNCIAPGPIATPEFWKNNRKDAPETKSIMKRIPLKRMGSPDDVAHAVSYFFDERSSFVTGQTLYVCGGLTVGLSKV